jgi:hypothetical protein
MSVAAIHRSASGSRPHFVVKVDAPPQGFACVAERFAAAAGGRLDKTKGFCYSRASLERASHACMRDSSDFVAFSC